MFATDDPDSILKVVDFGAASVFQKNIKLQQTKGTVLQWFIYDELKNALR